MNDNMVEQMLLLVDKNDRFLGKYAPKNKCHQGEGLHHRAFTILIRNRKGEVLLQKRKHKLWDKAWDLTNSHPFHLKNYRNESYQQAARRCLKREWGIEIPVKKIFGFNYFARFRDFCENEYCALFIGEFNGRVYPNSLVAWGYRWLDFDQLTKEIKINPKSYTPWLIGAVKEILRRDLGKLATKY